MKSHLSLLARRWVQNTCHKSGTRPRLSIPIFERLEARQLLAVLSGPMVAGAVTEDSARISLRTDEATSVAVEVATSADFSNAVRTDEFTTSSSRDFTQIVTISNLLPGTKYFYRSIVAGDVFATPQTYSFSTAPSGSVPEFRFAVTADLTNTLSKPTVPAAAYASIRDEGVEFMLQVGDFDHSNPGNLSVMRLMHRSVRSDASEAGADFAEFIAPGIPLYHIWDDHDFGTNNADKTFPAKADALEAFDEYYPTPTRPNENGIWHSFQYAEAEFFMLDVRSNRDPAEDPDGPDKSMLDGDAIAGGQLEWLKNGLRNSTATWKFLVSGVPFNDSAKPSDSWGAYARERNELLDFINVEGIENVLVISGDLHTGGALDDGTNSEIPEISVPHTNLQTNSAASGEPGDWSSGFTPGTAGGGYALITVREQEVVLETHGEDGSLRNSLTLTSDQVPPPEVIETLYFSTSNPGSVTGTNGNVVQYDLGDVIAMNTDAVGETQFELLLDGSDVGLINRPGDIDALAALPDGSFVISPAQEIELFTTYASPGVGSGPLLSVGRQDLLRFVPTSLGGNTTGGWEIFFRGSDHGLTDNAENIDAADVLEDGTILISTTGSFSVPGLSGVDRDIIAYDPVTNEWSLYFDGRNAELASYAEDIDALSVVEQQGVAQQLHLSTLQNFSTSNVSGGNDDVFTFLPLSLGPSTVGSYSNDLLFAAAAYALTGGNLNALDYVSRGAIGPDENAPTVNQVQIVPAIAGAGPLTITATGIDDRELAAMEAFLDVIGEPGQGIAMSAFDGAFDSRAETATAELSIATFDALSEGTHTLFVLGQDAAGNWSDAASAPFVKDTLPPTVSGALLDPVATQFAPLQISVTASDDATGGGPIAAGEFFVDALGPEGTGIALAASDGAFDSSTELLIGTIDIAAFESLAEGTHTVYLRGRDAAGNWSLAISEVFEKLPRDAQPATAVYFSTHQSGTLTGSDNITVSFSDTDLVRLLIEDAGQFRFSLYLDGSDVGLTTGAEDIDAVHLLDDGSILVSTTGEFSVFSDYSAPGVGSGATINGTRSDVLKFTPSTLGEESAGSWSLFFVGQEHGLSDNQENIDALAVLPDGRMLISTTGSLTTDGLTAFDRDVSAFDPTTGLWSPYFQGASVGFESYLEDVDGLTIGNAASALPLLYFGTLLDMSAPGITGDGSDISEFQPTSLGATTAGSFSPTLKVDASTFGFGSLNLNALHIDDIALALPSNSLAFEAELTLSATPSASASPTVLRGIGEASDSQTSGQFHNRIRPTDVNNDGITTARDALIVLNHLAIHGSGPIRGIASTREYYLDVNEDGQSTSNDALRIINFLTRLRESAGESQRLDAVSAGRVQPLVALVGNRNAWQVPTPNPEQPSIEVAKPRPLTDLPEPVASDSTGVLPTDTPIREQLFASRELDELLDDELLSTLLQGRLN